MEEESEKIASLIESLKDPDKKVLREAAETLTSLASSRPVLGEKLNRLLGETPSEFRWPIAYILAHLPNPSGLCVEVLLETIGSHDPDIRWAAVLLLVQLGKIDPQIVARLLDLLKNGSPTQRRLAVYCLRDIDLSDKASLQALLESLRDPEPLVRVAVVTSLKGGPKITKDGLNSLLQLFLTDPDSRVRYAAAFTLAGFGEPDDAIHKALREASRSTDPQLRKVAKAALDLLKNKGPTLSAKKDGESGPVVS